MFKKPYGEIYLITHSGDGKRYVGQTVQTTQKRFSAHKSTAKSKNKKKKKYIHRAMARHGIENFYPQVIYVAFSKSDLDWAEDFFINYYQSLYNQHGYNIDKKARGTGRKSEITKLKNKEWNRINTYKAVTAMHLDTMEIREYSSTTEASIDLGLGQTTVSGVCLKKKGYPYAKGWIFKFKEEEWGQIPTTYKKRSQAIVGVNLITKKTKEYKNIKEVEKDGFNRAVVYSVMDKHDLVSTHKNHTFFFKDEYVPLSDSEMDILLKKHQKSFSKEVISINLQTGKIKKYMTLSETEKDGFSRPKVGMVCSGKRPHHKGHKFYFKSDYEKLQGKDNV